MRRVMLLLCLIGSVISSATASNNTTINKYCPRYCDCRPQYNHNDFAHLNCSSTVGLESVIGVENAVSIHSIDLSHIGLTRVPDIVNSFPNVTSIDLSHNNLHSVDHLNDGIKSLDLQHNRIESLGLKNMPSKLQFLNLQYNAITFIPLELSKLTNLVQLELSHNAINCSCDTLSMRNWLQKHNVFMENAIFCAHPEDVEGKPWLQVSDLEICEKEQKINHLAFKDKHTDSETTSDDEGIDFIEAFIPIKRKRSLNNEQDGGNNAGFVRVNRASDYPDANTAIEGGDDQTVGEGGDHGSGSGEGFSNLSDGSQIYIISDNFEPTPSIEMKDTQLKELFLKGSDQTPPSVEVFNDNQMGIFDNRLEKDFVSKKISVPFSDSANIIGVSTGHPDDLNNNQEDILPAQIGNQMENGAAFLLLAITGLIVIGLVIFVCVKRRKCNSYCGQGKKYQKELECTNDLHRVSLEKHWEAHAPLVTEKIVRDNETLTNGKHKKDSNSEAEKTRYEPLGNDAPNNKACSVQSPTSIQVAHEYYPISPRYPTPQSPRGTKHIHIQPAYTTSHTERPQDPLPQSGRYSPVYSPETGRVKIRLCETPTLKAPKIIN